MHQLRGWFIERDEEEIEVRQGEERWSLRSSVFSAGAGMTLKGGCWSPTIFDLV